MKEVRDFQKLKSTGLYIGSPTDAEQNKWKNIQRKGQNIKEKENILSFQRKIYMKTEDSATLTARKKFLSNAEGKLFWI